ncbi:MAG: HAMP domain-containing sensor histidine kinase, partial [Sulfurimonadaceae bacterium]|nr:HAMP domain-containing sensor histidine kinase [Sulfurimonadaceae bacterium]
VDLKLAASRPDGETFPVNIKIFNETVGPHTFYLIFIHDLTSLQEDEQQMIQHSKRAAMGDMLTAIAHQWRQPLTSLGFTLQYLEAAFEEGKLTKQTMHDTISDANTLIRFMSQTIDDFQNFIKEPKLGDKTLDLESFEFVFKLLKPALDYAGIQLVFDHVCKPDRHTCYLEAPTSEMQQVLFNIIHNAHDALKRPQSLCSPEEKIIHVHIRLLQDNQELLIEITDNAGGIPENAINKIFDPYFTTKSAGNGIGLYISKMIVEKHFQGTISAENTDRGARFSIHLPVHRVAKEHS